VTRLNPSSNCFLFDVNLEPSLRKNLFDEDRKLEAHEVFNTLAWITWSHKNIPWAWEEVKKYGNGKRMFGGPIQGQASIAV